MAKEQTIVGYKRVSSTSQSLARQELPDVNDRIFEEKLSGATKERPALQEMLKYIRAGDEVHVHSIDRLARNLRDLQDIVQSVLNKDASIRFITEGLHFHDREGSQGDHLQHLMFQMLGAFAEFEKNIIQSRRQEGINAAKAAGKYKGRGKTIDDELIIDLYNEGRKAKEIAEWLGIGIASVYRLKPKEINIYAAPSYRIGYLTHMHERCRDDLAQLDGNNEAFIADLPSYATQLMEDYVEGYDGNPTGPEFKTLFEQVLKDMVKMVEDPLFYERERTSLIERCRKVDHEVYVKGKADGVMDRRRLSWLKDHHYTAEQAVEIMGIDAETLSVIWDYPHVEKHRRIPKDLMAVIKANSFIGAANTTVDGDD